MAETAPDGQCKHLRFFVQADVGRIGEEDEGAAGMPKAYVCEIQVRCEDCGERFRFNGVKPGLSYQHPMCSIDHATLIAPMRPASADPDFGKGLPGFTVRQVL